MNYGICELMKMKIIKIEIRVNWKESNKQQSSIKVKNVAMEGLITY